MLDRNVRNIINKKGFDYFFSGVKDIINNADIAVANLEGPFTDNPSKTNIPHSKSLQFTFDTKLAKELADFGFDILGLSNNHTKNFGNEGFEMTKKVISSSSMLYYGDPDNKSENSVIIEKNNIKIGFVGFHEFTYVNFDKVISEIKAIREKVDVLIVTPHWGVEYNSQPTEKQIKLAKEFIDNGADIVVGTHSHIIGDIGEYNNKKIYYSLGNFAFDQYFSKETMTGMGLQIEAKKGVNGIELDYKQILFEIDTKGVRAVDKQYSL